MWHTRTKTLTHQAQLCGKSKKNELSPSLSWHILKDYAFIDSLCSLFSRSFPFFPFLLSFFLSLLFFLFNLYSHCMLLFSLAKVVLVLIVWRNRTRQVQQRTKLSVIEQSTNKVTPSLRSSFPSSPFLPPGGIFVPMWSLEDKCLCRGNSAGFLFFLECQS